jgi:hypothetical protein
MYSFGQNNIVQKLKKELPNLNIFNDSTLVKIEFKDNLKDTLLLTQSYGFKNGTIVKNSFRFSVNDIIAFEREGTFITIECKKNTVENSIYHLGDISKIEKWSAAYFYTDKSDEDLLPLKKVFKTIISENTKLNFKIKNWFETINYIQKHKDSILDFHYYSPQKEQRVDVKDHLFIIKVTDDKERYVFNTNLKKLKEVKPYKEDGLLLNFGWQNVSFEVYDKTSNSFTQQSKRMHISIRVNDKATRNNLFTAFERLVVLNKKE